MAIQGLRDTSNFATNERPQNWRAAYLYLYPNGKAPLTALTTAMKESSTDDPTFNWWELSLDDRRLTLGQNIAASAANTIETWTLNAGDNAKTFVANDVLLIEQTQEQVLVYADPVSDTSITVVRGWAGTTTVAVTFAGAGINPNLMGIGSSYEEGSLAPTGVNYDPTQRSNNTQIFRRTLEITRTAQKTRLRTVDAVKEARRQCLEYVGVDMERAFWMGKKSSTTRNGRPCTTTAGIYNLMSSGNIYAASAQGQTGALDMDTLETYLELFFREGSSEKMVYTGNKGLLALQQIVRKNSQYTFESGIKEYNMNVTRVTTPFGSLVFKTHPLFTQNTGGTTAGVKYYGMNTSWFVLDMGEITYRYLTDSDLQYQGNLQAVGQDAMKSGYLAECGIELHFPSVHFLLTGVDRGLEDL